MTESNLPIGTQSQVLIETSLVAIDRNGSPGEPINNEPRQLWRTLRGVSQEVGCFVATLIVQLIQHHIQDSIDINYSFQLIERFVKAISVACRLERRNV